MALLFCDGFDHYTTVAAHGLKWSGCGASYTSGTGRTGSAGQPSNPSWINLGSGITTLIFGCAFNHASNGDTTFFVSDSVTDHVTIKFLGASGNLLVWTPNGAATMLRYNTYASGWCVTHANVPNVVRPAVWNYVEAKVVLHNSTGAVTIKVNGATISTLTNIDTISATTGGEGTAMSFGMMGFNTTTWFDDLYVCDNSGSNCNDFLGDVRVVTVLPSDGNGSNTDFTCSSSTDHGALVNESTPNDDTDYVYSSTLNHVDTWNYPALGYTGTIKAVQLNLDAKKTDAGTRAIAGVTRPASTNRVHGTNHYLAGSYAYWRAIWELNPEDSAAWEVADIDGAEFGVKVTV